MWEETTIIAEQFIVPYGNSKGKHYYCKTIDDVTDEKISLYTHSTEKVSPQFFSPLETSHTKSVVGSLSKIFHLNMMLIYYS